MAYGGELRRQSQDRSITFREYQEQAFKGIGASLEDMKAVVRDRATLRPYFKELWTYCRARAIPLAIVTVGLDFYVDALLEREGMEGDSQVRLPRPVSATMASPSSILIPGMAPVAPPWRYAAAGAIASAACWASTGGWATA